MGGLFTKSKKPSRVTEHDKAVLVGDGNYGFCSYLIILFGFFHHTATETTKGSFETIPETHRALVGK